MYHDSRFQESGEPSPTTFNGVCIHDKRNRLEDHVTLAKEVRTVIRSRRLRSSYLNPHLFGEPAWDLILELFALHLEQQRIITSKVSLVAGVPDGTAHRWMDKLQSNGLIERKGDAFDRRRQWIAISALGVQIMSRYFLERKVI